MIKCGLASLDPKKFLTECKSGEPRPPMFASVGSSDASGSSSLIFVLLPLRRCWSPLHLDLDSQAKSKVNRENSQRAKVK